MKKRDKSSEDKHRQTSCSFPKRSSSFFLPHFSYAVNHSPVSLLTSSCFNLQARANHAHKNQYIISEDLFRDTQLERWKLVALSVRYLIYWPRWVLLLSKLEMRCVRVRSITKSHANRVCSLHQTRSTSLPTQYKPNKVLLHFFFFFFEALSA